MDKEKNNFAYIDGANLHKGVADLGWRLNYRRFRVWLSEKYGARVAYLFDNALLVASDGDYAGLVAFLQEKDKFSVILSPHPKDKCSILLKRTGAKITYINDKRSHLELTQKEKAPGGDETPQGSFS